MSGPSSRGRERTASPAIATIQAWSTTYAKGNGYTPPECLPTCLQGTVTGHPSKPDGTRVRTSPIAAVAGRIITTQSGTRYRLGAIDPRFRAWMRKAGLPYDPSNPIRDRSSE